MRFRWFTAAALGATVVAGCKAPGGTGGSGAVSGQPFTLAKTPDINTPPTNGRYTLRLVWFITPEDPKPNTPDPRTQAEIAANGLREQGVPAFVLTRSLPRHGSKTDRTPVYYVCVGAFKSALTDDAVAAKAYFRQMKVKVGTEDQNFFKDAEFIILDTTVAEGADPFLSLYEWPIDARVGLFVGVFQGLKHRELAYNYAVKLRAQGQKPLIQETDVASRVLLNPSPSPEDPAFATLRTQFPKVEHNLLATITFRGVVEGADDQARATAVIVNLRGQGYDAFGARFQIRPPESRSVAISESRVWVVKKESGNYSLDGLRREYAELKPLNVSVPEYPAALVDLKGPWGFDIKNPAFKPTPTPPK